MELICPSLHLCNKNHGMLDLLLYMTHVVVVIMSNFNYITTRFLNLVKCFRQIYHLRPQYVNSYLKLYVREITMKYFIIRNVSMENIVMVVEILFYSTINTLLIMISHFQMQPLIGEDMNTTIILQVLVMHIPKELICKQKKYGDNFSQEIWKWNL